MSQEGNGLLRVTLPSASATCVSDGRFGDGLLESFHVVHAPEGSMFMDIFTRKAFLYRVVELETPRLVVDFKPKGGLKAPLPAVGGDTVLVEPRPHASISDPLTVNGYSRNSEAANVITLIDSDGKVLVRRSVLSNDGGPYLGILRSHPGSAIVVGKWDLEGRNRERPGRLFRRRRDPRPRTR